MLTYEKLTRFINDLHDQGVNILTIRVSSRDYYLLEGCVNSFTTNCEWKSLMLLSYRTNYGDIEIRKCSKLSKKELLRWCNKLTLKERNDRIRRR